MAETEEYSWLTEDKGVGKHIVSEGYGTSPSNGQQCVMHYTGQLLDKTVFDSSLEKDSPFKFNLGIGNVIKGWDIGVATMKKGERAILRCEPGYAYGDNGSPPSIPEKAVLVFTLELLDFYNKRKDMNDMSMEERSEAAMDYKSNGNENFKHKRWAQAIYCYKESLNYLSGIFDGEMTEEMKALRTTLNLNLSVVFNNANNFTETLTYCGKVLEENPNHPKGNYLRGVAHSRLGLLEEAVADLKLALSLVPTDTKVKEELVKAKQMKSKRDKKEKKVFKGFFDNTDLYGEKESQVQGPPADTGSGVESAGDRDNPVVYLDLEIGGGAGGRIYIELYKNKAPRTGENFRCLCTGEKPGLHYEGNIFHRVIPGFMMQGGDIENADGTGGKSIYGNEFEDEAFLLNHTEPGMLSMANRGPNTNSSQFFLLFKPAPHLDGRHVVFGKVIKGIQFVYNAENVKTGPNDKPVLDIVIKHSGELQGGLSALEGELSVPMEEGDNKEEEDVEGAAGTVGVNDDTGVADPVTDDSKTTPMEGKEEEDK